MNIDALKNLNHETLQHLKGDHRLVLLSPRYRSRNALISGFLANNSKSVYLYTLHPDDTTLHTLLAHLIENFRDFDPKFGENLENAIQDAKAGSGDLADAMAADVKKAKPKIQYLVLDSFDYLQADDFVYEFFYRLIEQLPHGTQVIINSRELQFQAWIGLIRRGDAIILGDDLNLDGGIYNPHVPESPHLEVYGFGGGNVFINGISLDSWDGPLPRNLFYYFIDHPMVTRDEIFDTFWPGLPSKEATNVFHVTKRKVSERLGYELTSYSGGFYRPSGQMSVHYDVARFEEIINESLKQEPETPEVWYQAIKLYRSPFLYGISMPWIEERREKLRLAYAQSLIGVGRLYKANDDSEKAISYYLRALREIPQREDIHRDIMGLYEARGERSKAIAQYRWLSDILKRTLNITPSKSTRSLYESISSKSN